MIAQFDPSRGGVERYAFNLAGGLASRGHRVDVFTQQPPPSGLGLPQGVCVTRVQVPRGLRRTKHRRFDRAVRRRLGTTASWDVVQGFGRTTVHTLYRVGGGTHAAYLASMSQHWPSWKRAFERINPKNRRLIRIEQEIFREGGARLIANSRRTRDEVVAHFGVPRDRIRVIHNGVDVQQFHPDRRAALRPAARARWKLPADAFVGAFVGSGFARKGMAQSLAIVAELARRGTPCHLLVAGRGPRRYARMAERLGIGAQVHWLGLVREVEQVHGAADFFLLPSLYEPFGIAPLEALASGLPVVVTRTCGVAEVLEDGREGLLLENPDAVEAACAFLERLAHDTSWREALGRRARATAEGLDMSRNVEQVLEVYRELLAQGGGRHADECGALRVSSASGGSADPQLAP